MAEHQEAFAIQRPSAFQTIVLGGLLVGVLDGLDAILYYGWKGAATTRQIAHFIASGLIGMRSYRGGGATVALGIALHFTIAFGAAAVFYLLSVRLPWVWKRPFVWGPIFGIGVYVFMYYVVIPLSEIPKGSASPFSWPNFIDEILAHIFLVGLPIAWLARRSVRTQL